MFEQVGEYKIIERIGHGGMGEVWLANRIGFAGVASACVVKFLHREHSGDPRRREHFINEARLAAQLEHPNIVKVVDAGEANGRLYLVMERVDGVNLNTYLKAMRDANLPLPLDVDIICYIVGEVLTGLEYAHGRTIAGRDAGIIHFDITPNNVMITSSGGVKLLDFGLSRMASKSKDVSFIAGTPRYMSVEHHLAMPRRASDVYGLGVIFRELLTNRPYNAGLEPDQLRERILHGMIEPLDRDDLAAWLVQLSNQMLAGNFNHRPEARAALDIILRNVPGYRRAAGELAKVYKNTIGPARSGMTQFLAALPDNQRSFFAVPDDEPRQVLADGGVATAGPTCSTPPPTPPPMLAPERTPGPAMACSPAVESEVTVEATEMLPGFSGSQLPLHIGVAPPVGMPPVRSATQAWTQPETDDVVVAATSVRPQSAPFLGRVGSFVLLVLAALALVSAGALLATWMSDNTNPSADERSVQDAADDRVASVLGEVEQRGEGQAAEAEPETEPAPSTKPEPSTKLEPEIEQAAAPKQEAPEPSPTSALDMMDEADPDEREHEEASTSEATKPKPKPPVKVVLYVKGHASGWVKIGRREHQFKSYAAVLDLAPGRYAAKWRTTPDEDWHSAGMIVVGDIAPNFYEFRLTEGSAERTERKKGGG